MFLAFQMNLDNTGVPIIRVAIIGSILYCYTFNYFPEMGNSKKNHILNKTIIKKLFKKGCNLWIAFFALLFYQVLKQVKYNNMIPHQFLLQSLKNLPSKLSALSSLDITIIKDI